jgi:DeoR/GlpR family transcriptional regulator of sugar metabolism
VHLEYGVTLRERAEAEVARAMIERSRRVIALAPVTKLGWAGPYGVADVEQLSVLVTDAPERVSVEYGRLGIEVVHT